MTAATRLNILLIENHPEDIDLTRIYLGAAYSKYDVVVARTFALAREVLNTHSMDLVLLDLILPDVSGLKTLQLFLSEFPRVPVIVLTNTNSEILGQEAIREGAMDYLVKGQSGPQNFKRVIRNALLRFQDKKELADALQKLQLAEKRYQEVKAMAQFGDWEMDLVTNRMTWSEEVYRIMGLAPNILSPTLADYLERIPLSEKDRVEKFFHLVAKDAQPHHLEHRIIVKGSSIRHLSLRAKLFFEEQAGTLKILGSLQDITAERKTTTFTPPSSLPTPWLTPQELIGKIQRSGQTIIKLYLTLEQPNLSPVLTDHLLRLRTTIQDLIHVQNYLLFQYLQAEAPMELSTHPFSFPLMNVLEQAVKVIQLLAPDPKVRVQLTAAPRQSVFAFADLNLLMQLFINLGIFLLGHTKPQETLEIRAFTTQQANEPSASLHFLFELGNWEGPLPDLTLPKFQTNTPESETSPTVEWLVSQRLIHLLKGNWSCLESKENGLLLSVELPVELVHSMDPAIADLPPYPLRILLAEDHFLYQHATQKMLKTWSKFIQVVCADNGQEAIHRFQNESFDLVLMDLNMPVLDGYQATEIIRASSDIPILALSSARLSLHDQKRAEHAGVNGFLKKPFKPPDLFLSIKQLLGKTPN